MGFLLIIGETRAFMIGRDFILAYSDFGERLYWAVIFTMTNQQLLEWLFCLVILALPLLLSICKKPRETTVV
jgi:hypothetical protein